MAKLKFASVFILTYWFDWKSWAKEVLVFVSSSSFKCSFPPQPFKKKEKKKQNKNKNNKQKSQQNNQTHSVP